MKNLTILLLSGLLFTGCGVYTNHYYDGNLASRSTISQKPAYRDSTVKATYISGNIQGTLRDESFNTDESSAFGTVNVHRAITKKHMNFSYGGFLHGGNYKTAEEENIAGERVAGGRQAFYGGGLNTEINYNLPFRQIDWRVIGAKLSYQYENGDFRSFRKRAKELGITDNKIHKTGMLQLNLTSEVVVKLKKHEFGYGISFSSGEFLYTGNRFFFTSDKYTFTIQRNQAIVHDGGAGATVTGFGFAYRIK